MTFSPPFSSFAAKSLGETMKVAVLKETLAGEKRVAAVPETVKRMAELGMEAAVEPGAGALSGFEDSEYQGAGARILGGAALLEGADLVLKVRKPSLDELGRLPEGCVLIASSLQPAGDEAFSERLRARKITGFSLDLMPRIARAQGMDVLSSMANIAGYKAVLLAANRLPKLFPMLITAAGTIPPARVLVIGAGVAGLQAVATARRLGAVVRVSDVRPAVKEQVESLGAQFVELGLKHEEAQDARGYAKEVAEESKRMEMERIKKELESADICITTAQVPGKRAPLLITEEMVAGMKKGSVIVDLAAEQGGNCALTEPGKEAEKHGVLILGPTNLVSAMAYQASQSYSRNILNFLRHIHREGKICLDLEDEIIRSTLVSRQGEWLQAQPKPNQEALPHGR